MKISKILFLTIIVVLCSQQQKIFSQQPFWKQTASYPAFGGMRIAALQINSQGYLFAGVDVVKASSQSGLETGVFQSTDNGATWKKTALNFITTDGTPGVVALAIAPNGNIFAATSGGVLYRSTNNGNNWDILTNLGTAIVQGFSVNKSGVVFAGTLKGVYRSTDGGNTWTQINNGFGITSNYFNVRSVVTNSLGYVFAATDSGVYRSTDNGDHWIGGGGVWSGSLAIDTVNGHIFVGTSLGIYRSIDNGLSWSNVAFSNQSAWVTTSPNGKIFASAVNPNSSQQTPSLYRSDDDGMNWTIVSQNGNGCFAFDSSGTIFIGYNGVIRSTDNGDNWIQPYLSHSWVTSLTSNLNGNVFAGTLGSYIFKTTDKGNSWTQFINGLSSNQIITLASNSINYLFAGTDTGGIYRSNDNGQSWTSINNGIGNNNNVFAFAIDSRNTIFAGCNPSGPSGGGVYISANNGAQWTHLTSTSGNVYSLALSPSGKVFAGTNDGKVYFSLDSGTTWNNTIITSTTVRSLIVDQFGNIFAGTDYPGGLYRSTDNGSSWSNIGFTNVSVTSLISNPALGIYLGTWGQGVFHSTDNGTTWNAVSDGLFDNNVLSLTFDASGYFYAGTQSSGVFRSAQPLITNVQNFESHTPKQFILNQNYPNPFNPSTTISFSLPHSEFTVLKIYDLLGKEITTLVSENLASGNYSFKWDASNQPSGLYFYRLQAGQYSETKKLLLLK
jgi:photosystem II stability/assembly factor-like uncharacterized protein